MIEPYRTPGTRPDYSDPPLPWHRDPATIRKVEMAGRDIFLIALAAGVVMAARRALIALAARTHASAQGTGTQVLINAYRESRR